MILITNQPDVLVLAMLGYVTPSMLVTPPRKKRGTDFQSPGTSDDKHEAKRCACTLQFC